MPEDRDGAAVLGNRLKGFDRGLEAALRVQAAVALLGERGVHHDERQLPRAGLAALSVPEPYGYGVPARNPAVAPADARVVAQAPISKLRRQPSRITAQVVVPRASK